MRVLVVGAGKTGAGVLRQLQKNPRITVLTLDPRERPQALEEGIIEQVDYREALTPLNLKYVLDQAQPDLIILAAATEEVNALVGRMAAASREDYGDGVVLVEPLKTSLIAGSRQVLVLLFGAVLHARARAALGPGWSPRTAPGTRLAVRGPYAYVRHPAYAGLMLMAIGSLLAHCSLAVGAAAIGLIGGLVLKARAEDRRLHERFGEPWRRWASEVPSWCPARLSRRGTRR